MFMTGWEEELYNDRMGISKPNPLFDFVEEPERKRQKFVVQGPWYEPSSRTMRNVGAWR